MQDFKNSFFYRTLPVATSKWGNEKWKKLKGANLCKCPEAATGDAV